VYFNGWSTEFKNSLFALSDLDGIACNGGDCRVSHCTFDQKFGIYGGGGRIVMRNSIVTNNRFGVTQAGEEPDVADSNFWGNQTDSGPGNTGSYEIDPGFSFDPGYAGEDDWRLSPTSPCVDAVGPENATELDLDGNPRPRDGDGVDSATEFDLGACEYSPLDQRGADADGGVNDTEALDAGAGVDAGTPDRTGDIAEDERTDANTEKREDAGGRSGDETTPNRDENADDSESAFGDVSDDADPDPVESADQPGDVDRDPSEVEADQTTTESSESEPGVAGTEPDAGAGHDRSETEPSAAQQRGDHRTVGTTDSGGCACRTTGKGTARGVAGLWLLLVAGAFARRRVTRDLLSRSRVDVLQPLLGPQTAHREAVCGHARPGMLPSLVPW
jgi:MYXO-CTERM domain-containing protein